MTYHTNHCWCNTSCWNNETFYGEVMVYFGEKLDNDIINENNIDIEDLDFKNEELIEIIEVFKKTKYDNDILLYKGDTGQVSDRDLEFLKRMNTQKTKKLTQKVLKWLNDNIKDTIDGEKGWCIPNDESLSNYGHNIEIWFKRQIDALKFIKIFSIYKEPTFYFDYFNSIRKDINISKLNANINILQDKKTIFNYFDCELLDWEKDEDDFELTKDEVKILIEKELNLK